MDSPELEDFRLRTARLMRRKPLKARLKGEALRLGALTIADVTELLATEEGYYLLLAAARLNRTTLKKAQETPEARVRPRHLRKAHAVRERLPVEASADVLINGSVTLRSRDLSRKKRGALEALFRERLEDEGIPIFMSPPVRRVPGLLISVRKPDGIAPDPASGAPPTVYLEIKNIRRVSDDIQKRLYEIAEVSLEMKLLYGGLQLRGVRLSSTKDLLPRADALKKRFRAQIVKAKPVVVAFFLCARSEAERYRSGAEAFIDKVSFQEDVEECLEFLRASLRQKP